MKYFEHKEFSSPDLPGSGEKMDFKFLDKLDRARGIAKIPFRISSGYRTEEHNKKVKGVKNSAHLKGLAADIRCKRSRDRFIIVAALMEVGFTRIGIGKTFIHVDSDETKAQVVIWLYK